MLKEYLKPFTEWAALALAKTHRVTRACWLHSYQKAPTMTWIASSRRKALPQNWSQIRRQIITREQGQCQFINPNTQQRCQAQGTEVHHAGAPTNHSPSTLILLCHWHHSRITAKQAAKAKKQAAKAKKQAKHPGTK